jgi:hypothetical protein
MAVVSAVSGRNIMMARWLRPANGMSRSSIGMTRLSLRSPANLHVLTVTLGPGRAFASKSSDNKGAKTSLRRTKKELNTALGDASADSPRTEAAGITAAQEETIVEFTSVYVHPLSQIVLRQFQTASGHEWICAKSLDQNLVLHSDGTFVLECPVPENDNDADTVPRSSSSLRVWTYYDREDRKHWLSVSVNQVQHRFLLQDNLLSAWQGYKRRSLAERIQESVQGLMDAVDELEE